MNTTASSGTNPAMDDARLRRLILEALHQAAPDADVEALRPRVEFRDQFGFDSIDHLNFVETLARSLAIRIPEGDYYRLSSLEGALAYLRQRVS